ncbi:MAG TPA: signal peptide peptidase SppA [Edaphocola sp.]|nr:signal peptide peptidase SppA [Edaphocola sp.]
MRQFFKFFFASLLALVVAGILFFVVFFGIVGAISTSVKKSISGEVGNQAVVKSNSVLVIDLSQSVQEHDGIAPFVLFQGGNIQSVGLHNLLDRIKDAKTDNDIKGIYLKAEGNGSGLATSQQIRSALEDFRKSGKFVYAYGDYISQSAYYVASVADSVFVNPMGSVDIKGLASMITFFKGALDKLEVQPEIFYCGKFKSATEPFRMEKMSEPNRKQLAALQSTIWDTYLQAFAEHTHADTSTINQWAQTGAIQTAAQALSHHLIDGIRYKDQIEDLLRQKSGLGKDDDLRLISVEKYSGKSGSDKDGDSKIALIIAQGEIVDKSNGGGLFSDPEIAADKLIKTIREVKQNDNIKAVVLRVNSPGGSAMASEKILRELSLLKAKKPLVVSMGDLAASGGYYISCQADSIFALPTTITGSIGVFGMMFNTQKFFNNKLGVTFDEEKNAPYADLGNSNRPMTDQEKLFIQNGVDSVYMTFKRRVATGRHKTVDYVDSIGQGRVWSGVAGVQNGLVDALGGLTRAFNSAASLAKLKNYQVETYPKSENQFKAFLSLLNGSNVKEQIAAQALLKTQLGDNYRWFKVLKQLQDGGNHVYMLMPFVPEIK